MRYLACSCLTPCLPVTLLEVGCQLLVQKELCRLVKLELRLPVGGGLALGPVTLRVQPGLLPGGAEEGAQQPGEEQPWPLHQSD